MRSLVLISLVLGLGCSSAPMPLDPLTADAGGIFSANEAATDVIAYELELEILPDTKSVRGVGTTVFRALEALDEVELQLDARFEVPRITVDGSPAAFEREGGVLRVALPTTLEAGAETSVTVSYSGRPWVAHRAPWDGGIVWATTEDGQPWVATAVQSAGCDLWWPCKDHFGDKPDRMDLHITVPAGLSAALNGVLQAVDELPDGRRTFHWHVAGPVSDYNVALNVGPYVRIQDIWNGINGSQVPLEFWALEEHEEQVRELIERELLDQVVWFEQTLGPYPWGDDKLGFVETPHLGMEHQTINAYGNDFRRDDHGFDWLLQHELSHEWFGNLVTHRRLNDAWIHEGFGAYMQPAYSLDRFGEAAYVHTMYETYLRISNCKAVVQEGEMLADEAFHGDIYTKGSYTLHTVRWLIGDEPFWRAVRRILYDDPEPWDLPYPIAPRYRSTEEVVRLFSEEAGCDLGWLFDAYLYEAELPVLEVVEGDGQLDLTWQVPGDRVFPMPVPIRVNGVDQMVEMTDGTATIPVAADAHIIVDPGMKVLRHLPLLKTCEEIQAEREERHDREASENSD